MSAFAIPACFEKGRIDCDPRADGAVRRVFMGDGRVVIDRSRAGIAMRLGIPCSAYLGVALSLAGDEERPLYRIRLIHPDPDLSVVLHETEQDDDIVAQWRACADMARLPRLLERGDNVFEPAEIWLGGLPLGSARIMRRRGAVAIRRRPRFLVRRRLGERRLMKKIF